MTFSEAPLKLGGKVDGRSVGARAMRESKLFYGFNHYETRDLRRHVGSMPCKVNTTENREQWNRLRVSSSGCWATPCR